MGRAATQLKWVVWKNFRLKRRAWKGTLVEVLFPILLVCIFAIIRSRVRDTKVDPKVHDDLKVPGLLQMQAMSLSLDYADAMNVALGWGPFSGDAKANVARIMEVVSAASEFVKDGKTYTPTIIPLESETALQHHIDQNTSVPLWGAVWFPDGVATLDPKQPANATVRYTIRVAPQNLPSSTQFVIKEQLSNVAQNQDPKQYVEAGFLSIQTAIDAALLVLEQLKDEPHLDFQNPEVRARVRRIAAQMMMPPVAAEADPLPGDGMPGYNFTGSVLRQFPTPAYTIDVFAQAIQNVFSLLMVFTFMISIRFLVSDMVLEKEKRIREGLKIMGLKSWVNWAGWTISAVSLSLFTMTIVCIIFKIGKLFAKSDFTVLWLFYVLFMLSGISFAFCMTTLFSKARTAGIVSMLLFMIASMPSNAFRNGSPEDRSSGSAGFKTLACLLSPTAFSLGNGIVAQREVDGIGVTWSNIGDGDFPLTRVLLMLFIDFLLFVVLAWYLDKVIPGEFGAAQRPWFCFMPSYWSGKKRSGADAEDGTPLMEGADDSNPGAVCEPEHDNMRKAAAVRVRSFCKTFPGLERDAPPVRAVNKLTLDMHEGDVFCLLGHNGAGKTTTISMLTGMTPPSSGDAFVFDRSVVDDIDAVREITGFCPQHDILFDKLTVLEHLRLFAGIKGVAPADIDREAHVKMSEVGLTEKADTLTADLSGGMKRKLSVALAFIGGSKVVYLDEPCSGIDPFTRRNIWGLIEKSRAGRVIVLTTHSMDEADILGDRIAIMSKGMLRTVGTSLFLKSNFGVGYHLSLIREDGHTDAELFDFVKARIPNVSALTSHAQESTFLLPISACEEFPALLDQFDTNKSIGVRSYGISVTTLEEVFIKIAEEDEGGSPGDAAAADAEGASINHPSSVPVEGFGGAAGKSASAAVPFIESSSGKRRQRTWKQQLRALISKRLTVSKRDKRGVYMQLLMPCFFLSLGAIAIKTFPKTPLNKGQAVNFNSTVVNSNTIPYAEGMNVSQVLSNIELYGIAEQGYELDHYNTTEALMGALQSAELTAVNPKLAILTGGANASNVGALGLFSIRTPHAPPLLMSILDAAVFRGITGRNISIDVTSQPLPRMPGHGSLDIFGMISSSVLSFYVVIAMSFIPAILASYVVKERETKAKHQQLVSGVNRKLYWFSNYIVDVVMFFVPIVFSLILFNALGLKAFTGSATLPMFLMLVLYGLAICPLAYAVSFAFNKHQLAQTATLMLFLFIGLIMIIVSYIFRILYLSDSKRFKLYGDLGNLLKYPFFLLPNYAVGKGMLDLSFQHLQDSQFANMPIYHKPSAFAWRLLGAPIVFLLVEIALYWVLTIYIEKRSAMSHRGTAASAGGGPAPGDDALVMRAEPEDDDVSQERARVEAHFNLDGTRRSETDDVVSVVRLRKVYPATETAPPKEAVKNLSIGIRRGECFGLLGPNGAGKSTSLNMLTGDLAPTSGTAWLAGYEILTDFEHISDELGYCPQADALLDLMTPREHLVMYARIKGMEESGIPAAVDAMIHRVGLSAHADKLSKNLSGGNKRKLSLANAMIGDPMILSVDEASTGVDPVARRKLWDVIAQYQVGRSVILTTHSLEEADALCNRIGIMVGGKLCCLGSSQHLKNKFGKGYLIELNVSSGGTAVGGEDAAHGVYSQGGSAAVLSENVERVKDFMHHHLVGSVLVEAHGGHMKYEIPKTGMKLSTAFKLMEENKKKLAIREYSISQPTLEQIFISFSRGQVDVNA